MSSKYLNCKNLKRIKKKCLFLSMSTSQLLSSFKYLLANFFFSEWLPFPTRSNGTKEEEEVFAIGSKMMDDRTLSLSHTHTRTHSHSPFLSLSIFWHTHARTHALTQNTEEEADTGTLCLTDTDRHKLSLSLSHSHSLTSKNTNSLTLTLTLTRSTQLGKLCSACKPAPAANSTVRKVTTLVLKFTFSLSHTHTHTHTDTLSFVAM